MKAGDLVKVKGNPEYSDYGHIGLIQWVDEEYPPRCAVIMNEDIEIYDPRLLEVINETR
jgi:hypothetical protein